MLINLNKLLWGIASIFIIYSGIYYSFHLKFIQFRFKTIFKSFFTIKNKAKGISPYQSLAMSLAAKIGVGSLAGVALAIYKGGVGSLFWLWMTAFISAPSSFSEAVLGVIYHKKDNDVYQGGPSHYIEKGLNKKRLAKLYAFLVISSYIFGFLTIQSNTITKSILEVKSMNPLIIGFMISFLTLIIIFKGIKTIASVTSKLVPIMAIIYLLFSLIIIIKNINQIPNLLYNIIYDAFNIKAFGWGIISSIIIGIQRGIFSNEAGLGTGAIAAATSNTKSPTKQGLIQMLGTYFTTLIVCSATAFIILTSNYTNLIHSDVNGIEITQNAMRYHFGTIGEQVLVITIILFAFSTIIAGYYYGEANLKFIIKKQKKIYIILLKTITALLLLVSSIMSSSLLWQLVDIIVAILAIVNIYALILLKDIVVEEWHFYKYKKYDKIKLK
ncbi:MAG: alanine/glycine:cation symporter family protein [Bacilli bacterium]